MSDILDGNDPPASLRNNEWTLTSSITTDLSTENTDVTMFASEIIRNNSDKSAPISEHPDNHRRQKVLCKNDKLPKETAANLSGKWLRRNIRITRVVFLVCTVFVVSWIPPWVCFFMATAQNMSLNPVLVRYAMFARMTHLLNTIANPILYTGFNAKFRSQLRQIFCLVKDSGN